MAKIDRVNRKAVTLDQIDACLDSVQVSTNILYNGTYCCARRLESSDYFDFLQSTVEVISRQIRTSYILAKRAKLIREGVK